MMNSAGIYIHIPFCKIKCMYCDFYSITKRNDDMPEFIDLLIKEINQKAKIHNHNWVFDTIFFGGGTPSLLKSSWIKRILDTLYTNFNFTKTIEITLEVNPGEVNLENFRGFKHSGINRLSLGFQSFRPKLLEFLSRAHGPEHISAYSLTVEKNTILHGQILKGNISMPSEKMDLKMFEYSQNYLNKNNYSQYEISNYALQGMECKHNLHYWNLDSYLAFGPAAHGYDGKVRWWNVSSLDNYMEKIKTNQSAVAEKEILNEMEHFNEIIFNGIRTKNGIKLKKLDSFSSYSNNFNASLKKWGDKLNISTKYVQLKKEAYKFADEIASDMMKVSN